MANLHTDSLGRATFGYIAPRADITPTDRERRWFQHLLRHGPQPSTYLYAATRDTHRCQDTALRQLQKLRAGGYLWLPPQQRHIAKADFNPYAYDLTEKARDHLENHDLLEPTVRPTGHWWHGYTTACVAGAIDLAAKWQGLRYIPAHRILDIKGSTLAIPVGRQRVIPDQLFALDYGGGFRSFMLEVDRGTEPKLSSAARKSWSSALDLYDQILRERLYQTHYGLKANLLVLWVFTNARKAEKFLALLAIKGGTVATSTLVQALPHSTGVHDIDATTACLFGGAWQRANGASVFINTI